ncbi:translation initiation factor Sui1 [Thiopseudomonas alkaliphila]|uniref:Translation initiation factor Sui1 n=1 Tax=Thiopseudomonas alkaliphila TaxID=1697053 RepID=A0AAW7DPW2_9GAMM|nr:translation initiation factor Sui1 [Thiopseudomonas alkaliphila]MDM1696142.1 translation initiation factor Sui1 [Thiopseudomonas alkaliphila]MDM1707855.1 translation initiation factor Sui1 [Thiopseudomonas alkaliphila]MDM1715632.1 translation initiation factor Sui1 [Thiopseudomonas alkaliphila]
MKSSASSRLVFSTDPQALCPTCQQAPAACRCQSAPTFSGDGTAQVRRETKGRGGKTVTTISGLHLDKVALKKLCAELKKRCGVGGAVKDEQVIEMQGDQVELLLNELNKRGFTAKKTGG